GFGSWTDAPVSTPVRRASDPISRATLRAAAGLSEDDRLWLAGALATDEVAWATEYGVVRDATGLTAEQNAFRYHAVPVTVRHEGARTVELLRVVAAGARAGAELVVSSAGDLPTEVREHVATVAEFVVEDPAAWAERVQRL